MLNLSIPDMSCGHCRAAVEKAVGSVDPAASVEVDLERHTARVRSDAAAARILAALAGAGYPATAIG